MNTKKLLKYILYILLGVVLLNLWNDWQKDHVPPPQATQTTQTSNSVAAINHPAVQSKPLNLNTEKTPSGRTIAVHTNVFDFNIDTLGGSIVGVGLPKYPVALHSSKAFQLITDDPLTHYTAQSGLNGFVKGPIVYNTAHQSYVMRKGEKLLKVVLQANTNNGLQIAKIFTFHPNSYLVDVSYHITNNGSAAKTGNMQLQISRTNVKPPKSSTFTIRTYYGFAMSTPQKHYQRYKFSNLSEQNANVSAKGGWLAMTQHYFLTAWIPNSQATYHYYSHYNSDNGIYNFGASSPNVNVLPNKSIDFHSEIYVGPKISDRLDTIAPHLSMTIDYGWLWPISIVIFWLMEHIHMIVGNWGFSIILVTVLIKLLFWKPSTSSYRSMAAMRALQPKIAELKERLGDDKQTFSREMMGLYKKEKVNPLGGCLPILIQIPFFIALYWVLIASVQLRQAPFIFWIHDLAARDPYYVLPVLMGISMFFMQKLSPPPPDPTQAKIMMLLPVFVTVIFFHFPAGLILYMLVNNIVSIIQQKWVMARYKRGDFKKEKQWQRKKK